MMFEIAVNHSRALRVVSIDLDYAEEAGLMPPDKRIGIAREAWEARAQWGGPSLKHTRTTLRLGRKTYCFEVARPLRAQ
ncbi:hypothetical protein [Sphingobium sp. EP60837]|uniref:hypothetical protein n=1 Tax=Sphingobium sp. EP60837 TaxID=1855519 RepID=UPI0007DE21BB|nr:hypothetical protein [Sphingobium sp. EP60837]ANI77661.1 hypothetical protein EP837_01228 [Sphingobium sp. EP60837]